MKSKILFLFLFVFFFSLRIQAQMGLNFQGVARNSSNAVITNQAVSLRLSILQGSATGSVEYSEIRKVNTNAQGLFNAVIGESGGTNVTGDFSTINWKNIPKFLKIELDVAGGTNFVLMGTTQFQYVAYAQFANAVDAANIKGIIPAEKGGTGFASINELKTALAIDKSLALKANISRLDSSLAEKVDKISGKVLSTNDYTAAEKTKLAGITGTNTGDQDLSGLATIEALALKADKAKVDSSLALKATISKMDSSLATKVVKVTGKGLSTNDYTTAEKTKLAGIIGTNTGDQDLSGLATTVALALKADKAKVDSSLALKTNISKLDSSLATKVEKLTGKGLSTNDYSTAEKTKLAGITGNNTGDQDLSGLATKAALALKADKAKVDSILALKANISKLDSSLATKVEKLTGKGLSTNDYSTAEKTKLAGITGTNTGDQTDISGNAATATLAGNISATNNNTLTSLPNLTNLGTITSGTWSGTAINAGSLSGTTLATNVLLSSLTKVGVLTNTTINGKLTVGGELGSSPSAILEVNSTNRGFLPPRMGYLQRNAIVNPEKGLSIFCTDCGFYGEIQFFDGYQWNNMSGSRSLNRAEKYIPLLGSFYGGGIIAYILEEGDPGYDNNFYKGFILAMDDAVREDGVTKAVPLNPQYLNPQYSNVVTSVNLGTGLSNTNAYINVLGNNTSHASGLARSYRGGGFSDWYLPSHEEVQATNRLAWVLSNEGNDLGLFFYNSYVLNFTDTLISDWRNYTYLEHWTSSVYPGSNNEFAFIGNTFNCCFPYAGVEQNFKVRPIRNFKIAK